jgi:hypothetical protein
VNAARIDVAMTGVALLETEAALRATDVTIGDAATIAEMSAQAGEVSTVVTGSAVPRPNKPSTMARRCRTASPVKSSTELSPSSCVGFPTGWRSASLVTSPLPGI